jgi:hypothetical protein
MGTRSLTYVYNEDRERIICMYRQFDGYPTGHGYELAQFLNSIDEVVNGIPFHDNRRLANGMGCLAAQLVAHFKTECGNIYLYPPKDDGDYWQEYEYHVYHDRVTVKEVGNENAIFVGPWSTLEKFCKGEPEDTKNIDVPSFDTDVGRQWLLSVLKDSKLTVTFEKNDGTERVMKCTLREDVIVPTEAGNIARPGRKSNPEVCPVWDIEANAWRSFRFDSIKQVAFTLGE